MPRMLSLRPEPKVGLDAQHGSKPLAFSEWKEIAFPAAVYYTSMPDSTRVGGND